MKSLGSRPKGPRQERIQASPRWAGDGFRNVHPVIPGLKDPDTPMPTVKDFFCEDGRRVPTAPLPSTSPLETWRSKPQSGLRVTSLGHSTGLIGIDGGPGPTATGWGPPAPPFALVGPKRFQPVPVTLREMPPVDVVIISH